jgi:AAA domain
MSGAGGAGLRERAKTYAIRDTGGRLVAYHVREDLPDGTKKVRWKLPDGRWGLNGTPLADLPLYGAEMVSDLGEDELIVLTEGEKARDALEVVGIPAVGTVTGASITPGAEALEVLRGRRVALWADNDDAGRAHMQRIAETLHDVAAEVLIYTWDDAPENGDAADHPAVKSRDSKAVDRLLNDLEGSPRWKPASVAGERSARNLPFKSGRAIAETAPEEVPWTCRPWAAKRAITEVTGAVKQAGKTTLVMHICRKNLDGEDFMGEPTVKTPIVYLTEQQASSLTEALGRAGLLDREDFVTLAWHDTIGIPWPEVARAAADEAERIGAQVLVVDTLGQFASLRGDAENNAGAALEALRPLQEAAARGLAVILVRHDRKAGGMVGESGRGSSAFAGAVDIIIAIRRGDGNTRPTVRKIESLSRFSETPTELMVELGDEGYRSLGTETAVAAQRGAQGRPRGRAHFRGERLTCG